MNVALCIMLIAAALLLCMPKSISMSRPPILNLWRSTDVFSIYLDGEPLAHASPASYDLCILSGGASLHANAFYLPLLPLEGEWTFPAPTDNINARPIDVLYRSSLHCHLRRNQFARRIRTECEDHGFIFEAAGACTVGGRRYTDTSEEHHWAACHVCRESKVILALENFSPGHAYMSEKPFLGLEHGALVAYVGNGQELMNECGVNLEKFVFMGDDYSAASADAAARDIVSALRNPEKLRKAQVAPSFMNETLSLETMDVCSVKAFCDSNHKLQIMCQQGDLKYFVEDRIGLSKHFCGERGEALLSRMLGVTVTRATQKEDASVVISSCC